MCGIAGFCAPRGRFGDNNLQTMLRAIHHRGPDDGGTHVTMTAGQRPHSVWMGSRRLAIQDLSSAGHQPMIDVPSGDVISFNGEIYNFPELRDSLEKGDCQFRSLCDTEVALQSWRRAGLEAVRQWRGMFSAALWNQRKEELWLVRDDWGIKPLYYSWDGDTLAFCSEVRALLAAGIVAPKLEWRAVEDYLRFGAVQDPLTIVEGIYALLPGHALRWSNGQIEIQRFAKPLPEAPIESTDVETELREIVRQQLVSDVPVTVFLSGGVDSSVFSLLARQEGGQGVNTMSVVFDEAKYTEGPYARRVAKHIGTEHHEVLLRPHDLRAKVSEAIKRMDQPTSDGINSYIISQAARQAGFTVALTGLGGDEFFGGYETFRRTPRIANLLEWCRKAPAAARAAGRIVAPGFARMRGAPRKFSQYLRYATFEEHPFFLQRTLFFPPEIRRLCWGRPSQLAQRVAEARLLEIVEEAAALDELNQVSYFEARTYMANTLLRDGDQMSMAHSLELRVPLVDQKLAASVFALTGKNKGLGKEPKMLLRKAFERQLPKEVFDRKKMGFTLPFDLWLRTSLKQEVQSTLVSGMLWEPEPASAVWEEFEDGVLDWSRPWSLYVLSRWVAQYIPTAVENRCSAELSQATRRVLRLDAAGPFTPA
jgi:asparagine synthase (glutamine-hydrolysing)